MWSINDISLCYLKLFIPIITLIDSYIVSLNLVGPVIEIPYYFYKSIVNNGTMSYRIADNYILEYQIQVGNVF